MIKLYTAGTPNGRKISIFPEEAGLAYETHVIDIHKGDQFDPAFQLINPLDNNAGEGIDTVRADR